MTMQFKKATKQQAKGRIALHGPSGAGKTFSALAIAKHLGNKIALIDTERGSAAKYSDKFDFDVLEIADTYHPNRLLEALAAAKDYDVVIVDSLSHFWNGPGGMLELVDDEVKKQKSRPGGRADSFAAWKSIDPIYRRVVQALLATPFDLIVTMRAKTEYERTESNGKTSIKKVGMAPEIRGSFEYEMDVEGMLDVEHNLVIGKTRCDALDGKVFTKPGEDIAKILRAWLSDGAVPVVVPPASEPAPAPTPPPSAPESGPQVATPPTAEVPAMATRAQEIQTAMLAAKDEADLGGWRDIAKKEMKGQYFDACKKAYSRRFRELNPKKAAS